MIDYEYLDEEYGEMPVREKVQRSMDPEGSLTDHRRKVSPNRNGAYKRLRKFKEEMRNSYT